MTISKGVGKKIAFKKESTWGTAAGATGAKYLRRVTSDFNLTKENYESAEIRTDYQVADMRHGIRAVDGSLNGELSPGAYPEFIQAVVAKDFAAVTALTGLDVTIAVSGSFFTFADAGATFITDGIKVGQVIALTGAGLDPANVSNNALVLSLSETSITVKALSSTAFVAEGPIASVTLTVRGKVTYAPLDSHTDDSFTVEEWYSDIAQSEVFTGVKVGTVAVSLPTTGLVTSNFTLMGKDRAIKGTSQYFTTPTAAPTEGIFASVSGALVVNGTPVGLITQLDLTIDRGLEPANVVGQNTSADMFTGRIRVNGNFSTYFQDAVFRDYFDDESTISLVVALTTGIEKDADAMSFVIPKIKIGSADKADSEMGIIQSHSFVGLLNTVTTAGLPATTVYIQDTSI